MRKVVLYLLFFVLGAVFGSSVYRIAIHQKDIDKIMNLEQTLSAKEQENVLLQEEARRSVKELEDESQKALANRQQEIEQLKQQASSQEAEAEKLRRNLQYEQLSDLPVRISMRKALTTETMVLQLMNFGSNTIRVRVAWAALGTSQNRVLDLEPNVLTEIGTREGFPFKRGDTVSIVAEGYKARNVILK